MEPLCGDQSRIQFPPKLEVGAGRRWDKEKVNSSILSKIERPFEAPSTGEGGEMVRQPHYWEYCEDDFN